MATLSFELQVWPWPLTYQMQNCAKLFLNPCISLQIIVWTSSIYDHFLIWPSKVTLTFNLPEQMFQTEHLLLKDNNYAKLFWNPWINVQLMAWTSSVYDHIIIYLQVWPLPSTYLNNGFKLHFYSSRTTTVPNYFEIHALMYKLWPAQAQFMTLLSFDLQVWPWPSILPQQMFQTALLLLEDNDCQLILKFLCYGLYKSTWMDACTSHKRTTHTHTPNWNCKNYVSLTTSGLGKYWQLCLPYQHPKSYEPIYWLNDIEVYGNISIFPPFFYKGEQFLFAYQAGIKAFFFRISGSKLKRILFPLKFSPLRKNSCCRKNIYHNYFFHILSPKPHSICYICPIIPPYSKLIPWKWPLILLQKCQCYLLWDQWKWWIWPCTPFGSRCLGTVDQNLGVDILKLDVMALPLWLAVPWSVSTFFLWGIFATKILIKLCTMVISKYIQQPKSSSY